MGPTTAAMGPTTAAMGPTTAATAPASATRAIRSSSAAASRARPATSAATCRSPHARRPAPASRRPRAPSTKSARQDSPATSSRACVGHCQAYCNRDADCGGGVRLCNRPVAGAETRTCTSDCDPLDEAACAPVREVHPRPGSRRALGCALPRARRWHRLRDLLRAIRLCARVHLRRRRAGFRRVRVHVHRRNVLWQHHLYRLFPGGGAGRRRVRLLPVLINPACLRAAPPWSTARRAPRAGRR